jgi:hypothetical protein
MSPTVCALWECSRASPGRCGVLGCGAGVFAALCKAFAVMEKMGAKSVAHRVKMYLTLYAAQGS